MFFEGVVLKNIKINVVSVIVYYIKNIGKKETVASGYRSVVMSMNMLLSWNIIYKIM